ncbi:MAG TPA: dihydropteroate synthase [Chitinophagaceae bacterium]|nr:dihydropteroate synthase [Chitinophagaceae bacterium]HAN38993.1 dihydropteroate synthase [Chitinophagaceae bacterium]
MLSIQQQGQLLTLEHPIVMGIVNATPDSFYEGSRLQQVDAAITKALNMIAEGATVIDIGGQSTRPGSEQIGASEEAARVIPVIAAVKEHLPQGVFISVDTYHSSVAEQAIRAGAHWVNDVSGGLIDDAMLPTVAAAKVPYVCMHMQGTPGTMQQNPTYNNVVTDVYDFFTKRIDACRRAGINDVIIDVGFGFGKTITHNLQLLHGLHFFQQLACPILVGISRKSTIYKTLNCTPAEALNGTTVLNTIALQQGTHILRVHDVKPAIEAIQLITAMQNAVSNNVAL